MWRCASCGSAACAHRLEGDESSSFFGEAAHQIQHRIDDAPGDVAPERADQHRAHIFAAGLGDAERAGERQDHDQSEEHFGDAIDRVEDSLAHDTFGGNMYSVMAKIA